MLLAAVKPVLPLEDTAFTVTLVMGRLLVMTPRTG